MDIKLSEMGQITCANLLLMPQGLFKMNKMNRMKKMKTCFVCRTVRKGGIAAEFGTFCGATTRCLGYGLKYDKFNNKRNYRIKNGEPNLWIWDAFIMVNEKVFKDLNISPKWRKFANKIHTIRHIFDYQMKDIYPEVKAHQRIK